MSALLIERCVERAFAASHAKKELAVGRLLLQLQRRGI